MNYWWLLPALLTVAGLVLCAFTRIEGGDLPRPTWHIVVGTGLILAAAFISIGYLMK